MKNIKNFDEFLNEEISDEFLNKSIDNAKEKGRNISKGYEDSLRNKHKILKDRNINNSNKTPNNTDEDFEKLSYEIEKNIDDKKYKIGNYDNLIFTVSYYNRNLKFMFSDAINDTMIKLLYNVDDDSLKLLINDDIKPISTLIDIYSFLIGIFKKYIPESKYSDRKVWSNLD